MAYAYTVTQADEVIRMLGFDGQIEDAQCSGLIHHYFLEDGTIIEVGTDGQIQHQQLVEDSDGDLIPQDMKDVTSDGVDYGVIAYYRDGKCMGFINLRLA